MAQGYPVFDPRFRLFTANGAPAANYYVYTYAAGTSTPLAVQTDSTLASNLPNPFQLDGNGEATIFAAAGVAYKINVKDALNNQVAGWPIDGILIQPAPPGSGGNPTAVPPGGIIAYGAAAAPTGFLLCDGSLVSRATYAALFAIIGTSFGAGDGVTTFAVPDLRGRFPLGKAASGTGSTLAGTGGAIDHVHTGPSHTHSVSVTRDGWGQILNAPSISGRLNTGYASGAGQFNSSYQPTGDLAVTSAAGGTGNTGTANPPYLVVNYIIKT